MLEPFTIVCPNCKERADATVEKISDTQIEIICRRCGVYKMTKTQMQDEIKKLEG